MIRFFIERHSVSFGFSLIISFFANFNRMDFSSNSWAYDIQPLVDRSTLTAYERLNNAAALTRAILTCDGESLLVRNSYCWKKDGLAILDAPQSMSMNQVCKKKGWKIVETYGPHLAVIAEEAIESESDAKIATPSLP